MKYFINSFKYFFAFAYLIFPFFLPLENFGKYSTDVNLVVIISDCTNGTPIPRAYIEVPTAAVHAGSQSFTYTDDKGYARIYPLRFGNQQHQLFAKAQGYQPHQYQNLLKAWSSYEVQMCLFPEHETSAEIPQNNKIFAWSEKYPLPYADQLPVIEDCQCVAYWSRSQFGSVLSIGVAGLSPDLMVKLEYFRKIPPDYGFWQNQAIPHQGDTIIIQPQAFIYRYSFTGKTYGEYVQPRPGHIGIIESVKYLDGVSMELVGNHYNTFYGWQIRMRNANWPAAWMENNRYYPERVGRLKDEIVCKNVGVSDMIIPENHPLITFWGLKK